MEICQVGSLYWAASRVGTVSVNIRIGISRYNQAVSIGISISCATQI